VNPCNWILHSIHDGETDSHVILFSVYSGFYLSGEAHSQNSRYWASQNVSLIHHLLLYYPKTSGSVVYEDTFNFECPGAEYPLVLQAFVRLRTCVYILRKSSLNLILLREVSGDMISQLPSLIFLFIGNGKQNEASRSESRIFEEPKEYVEFLVLNVTV
jgi:hypothetical protein